VQQEQQREGKEEALVKALEDVKLSPPELAKIEKAEQGVKEEEEGAEEEVDDTEALEEFLLEHAPDTLRCPISLELFKHPVVAMDSHTYEEAALVAWIEKCKSKGQPVVSPKTNAPMAEGMIFGQGFKTQVLEYVEAKTKEYREMKEQEMQRRGSEKEREKEKKKEGAAAAGGGGGGKKGGGKGGKGGAKRK
jgi:hypothetical protein